MNETIDNPRKVRQHLYLIGSKYSGVTIGDCGTIAYFLNGKLHRTDGPAVTEPSGSSQYFFNGKLHREDGPAVYNYYYENIMHDEIYFIDGIQIFVSSDEELQRYLKLKVFE